MCHADEQLFHQGERLLGVVPHPQRVARQRRHPHDGHPPVNPAKQRRRLVGREIVAGPNLEQQQDVAQCARVVEVIGRLRPIHFPQPGEILADPRRTSPAPAARHRQGPSLWRGQACRCIRPGPSCAIAKPPCSLMRLSPAEPLVSPVPDRITLTAREPYASASA